VRYGVTNQWSPNIVIHVPWTKTVSCDNGPMWYGDPAPNVVKSCEVLKPAAHDTPLRMFFAISKTECMAPNGNNVGFVSCQPNVPIPANAMWVLRPTKYPS